jgi:lipid-binding SYLF domain-containing protein
MKHTNAAKRCKIGLLVAASAFVAATSIHAQKAPESQLAIAAEVLRAFTSDDENAIPIELLQRARGIAVIPNVIRGGFIFGARRGRGVLAVRTERGDWSNPAFVTLTGGSAGLQIGVESTDLVLIFANDNAVKNLRSGKFTLGGDASAVAGPLGRHATMAVTFRAEVYGYVRSRGLFAGAAFQGARLAIDAETAAVFYGSGGGARALDMQNAATPESARQFLSTLTQVTAAPVRQTNELERQEEAATFPLE